MARLVDKSTFRTSPARRSPAYAMRVTSYASWTLWALYAHLLVVQSETVPGSAAAGMEAFCIHCSSVWFICVFNP